MEVSALKPTALPALRGTSALLRLQSDERLIEMIRRGQHAAFETLFSRYQPRLLAFCRHMLGSREDAEDVLQEVFTAAFNAMLADQREINVRPWLYRIARNRSLNHLRKASAIGVDSMDVHYAEGGISTGEKVMRRESFRQLIADVQQLPETQRTALLLREIDALSYDQIAEAMETTIPSVKSLLVRARISLAEAAEARQLTCDQVREELGEAAEGLSKLSAPARRHVRGCERCRNFRQQLKRNNVALAAVMPVGAMLLLRKLLASKLGAGASHVAGGAGAGASAAAGSSAAGGLATAGVGTIATKAVAGLAAAAIVTAGAVAAGHSGGRHRHLNAAASPPPAPAGAPAAPVVVGALAQPPSSGRPLAVISHRASRHRKPGDSATTNHLTSSSTTSVTLTTSTTSSALSSETETAATHSETSSPSTEVVTETTELNSSSQTSTSTTSTTSSSPAASSSSVGPTSPVVTIQPSGGTAAPPAEGTASPSPTQGEGESAAAEGG